MVTGGAEGRTVDKERRNQYQRDRRKVMRLEQFDDLGGKCSKCGRADGLVVTRSGLLCYWCRPHRTFTHGTIYGFKYAKCSCLMCTARKLAYRDDQNFKARKKFRIDDQHAARKTWGRLEQVTAKRNVE